MTDFKMTDHQKELFDDLTPLQQKVCTNIVAGMSNIDAFMSANQKVKNRATGEANVSRMLGHAKVKAFLDSMKAAAVSDAVMSREEAMTILSRNARVKVSDIAVFSYIEVGKGSDDNPIMETVWRMKDSHEIDPEVMQCIKSVTMTKQGPKIELHDQQAAIKQLATMQGWDSAIKYDLSSKDGTMSPKGKSLDDFYGDADKGDDVPA